MHWKPQTFVLIRATLYPLFLIVLHLSGWGLRTLPLAFLSASSVLYIWSLVHIVYPFFFSPLRFLPEPSNPPFLGHNSWMVERALRERLEEWIKSTPNDGLIHFLGFGQRGSKLILTTPETIAEVLNNKAYDWEKPWRARRILSRALGDGLVVVEGKAHRMQRKSVGPAFQGKHIRDLVPIFWSKARHLTDAVTGQMHLKSISAKGLRTGIIDITQVAQRITLDIIGKAALGKDMDTVVDPSDELAKLYSIILVPSQRNSALTLLNAFAPEWFLRRFPWKTSQRIAEAARSLRRVCRRIVAEKRAAINERNTEQKDILSVLIRSSQFDDDYLVDQLLTFLAAGHETTSNALTWASYMISLHPEIQSRLRQEIQTIFTETSTNIEQVTAEMLDSMPYLHAVCSEVLRYWPSIPMTAREAVRTTSIGEQVVPKGTISLICTYALNRLPALWGHDADQFNPERWMPGKGDPHTGGANSRYNFLTFLHGPRSCIGQGFALMEMKCLLAALVLRFEMDLVREEDRQGRIEMTGMFIMKPKNGMLVKLKEFA